MTSIRIVAARALALSAMLAVTATAQGVGGLLPTVEEPPTRAGTRGANWLHIAVGARANAMAGAIGSTVTGPTSWFTNPAGAATVESFGVAAGRQNLYGSELGIDQTYVGLAFPLLGGAIGLAINSLNSGDIPFTDEAAPFGDVQRGRFFQWTSTAVQLGYARRLTDRLDVGGSLKLISEGMRQVKTDWVAFDIGTQFRTGLFGLTLSGALQQLGGGAAADGVMLERGVNTNDVSRQQTRFKLFTRPVELPTAFKFSVGDDLLGGAESLFGRGNGDHSLYAEVAVNDAVDLASQAGVGVEYGYKNMLFARGGKRFYNDKRAAPGDGATHGMSGGFGVRVPVSGRALRFDYSFTALGDLRDIQVFSIEFGGR